MNIYSIKEQITKMMHVLFKEIDGLSCQVDCLKLGITLIIPM